MMRDLGRKGVVFTLMAFILLAWVVAIVSISLSEWKIYGENVATLVRSNELSYLLSSISEDLERETKIITRRNVAMLLTHIILEGNPVDSSEEAIEELILNGSYKGVHINGTEENTLPDWISKIKSYTIETGFEFEIGLEGSEDDLEFVSLDVSPCESWSISVLVLIENVTLRDSQGYPSWNGPLPLGKNRVNVSILFLEDPFIPFKTKGVISRIIVSDPYPLDAHGNPTVLRESIEKRYYNPGDGPSFMERLEKNSENREYYESRAAEVCNATYVGIETWVDVEELLALGLSELYKENQTTIDYIYFGPFRPGSSVEGAPWWFRIDDENAAKYGIT